MPRGVKVRVLSWAMHKNSSAALSLVFDKSKTLLLLVKRRDVPMWVLPGGGVDSGESPEDASRREVFEESGLRVEALQKVAYYTPLNKLCQETHLYRGIAQDGILLNTDESCDAAFFRLNEFPENTFYIHRNWVEEVIKADGVIHRPLHEITYFSVFKYFLKNPLIFLRYLLSWMGVPLNS